jgi:chitin synthase
MFCPQAVCKTVVPERFRILLSQRRRWINSTVHNLFELMLVRDLCGTFCFSMQFVVFMDLVGTLVLPAAISFTLYVLLITILPESITHMPKPIISLILLAFILGLPGVLIVITSRKVAYVGWMLIYIISIPIWNFVLPAYAYWHMDDFTWGETRKIVGEAKEEAHGGKQGEFNSRDIVMKRWVEFERERRWKTGVTSRDDSMYDVVQRSSSPKGMPTNRYSMSSTSETGFSGGGFGTSESNPLFRHSTSGQSMAFNDNISNLALPPRGHGHHREPSPVSSDSGHRLPPAQYGYDYSQQYQQQEDTQGMNRVSLVDSGPVPAAPHDPVRRVSRHNRRSSSRNALSPLSNTSHTSQLPPGAVSFI